MQTFDSNGPDVRVRGNAHQVYEKYLALARDANSSGDRIAAESYYQFAEHYYRIVNDTTDPQRQNPAVRQGQGSQPYPQRGPDRGDGGHGHDDGGRGPGNGHAEEAVGADLEPTANAGDDGGPGQPRGGADAGGPAKGSGASGDDSSAGDPRDDVQPQASGRRRPGRPRRKPANGGAEDDEGSSRSGSEEEAADGGSAGA